MFNNYKVRNKTCSKLKKSKYSFTFYLSMMYIVFHLIAIASHDSF